jgi:rhamnulokinase
MAGPRTSSTSRTYIAFDIGGSNGRCLAGRFNGEKLSIDVVSRFDNGYVRIGKHLYWDIVGLWNSVKRSLRQASAELGPEIASIGIDTWGTDFGLLDAQGNLISNPLCYRDPHTAGMVAEAQRLVPREEIFRITGVQFMEINTLYHLMALARAHSPALDAADTLLFIPDLLGYWLTGRKCCEYTNASTSQAMDAGTKRWAYPLLRRLGVPEHIFPDTIEPGSVLAGLSADVREETGLGVVPVVAVGSHDTASAVAGVPAVTESFAYLSSGTWGLLGAELPQPILTDKVLGAGARGAARAPPSPGKTWPAHRARQPHSSPASIPTHPNLCCLRPCPRQCRSTPGVPGRGCRKRTARSCGWCSKGWR